jgi:diacylglycerol kinase (ATP)
MDPIGDSTSREIGNNLPEIVLINPKAGSAATRSGEFTWKPLLPANHKVISGNSPAETERLAAQAAADQVPRLIIVGGDGTLHHALNGILSVPHTTTRLAIIPNGTANDYAASLQHHALGHTNSQAKVDVGLIRYDGFQRYFINVAGIGLTAHAALSSHSSPWLPARLRYTLGLMRTLVFGWLPTDTSIQLPGQSLHKPQLLTLSVAIGSREGSFTLAPTARLDDGQFNILIASNLRRLDVLRYLPGLMVGKLPQADTRIQYLLAPHLQFRSSTPLHLHLDGEIYNDGTLPTGCDITITNATQIDVELIKPR